MKSKLTGVLLAIALVVLANFINPFLPGLGTTLIALILGVLLRQVLPSFHLFELGVKWTEKYVLESAIVLIGFGFQTSRFKEIGTNTLLVILLSVAVVIILSAALQKLFGNKGKDKNLFLLLGAGSAICGSSAIGATASLIHTKEEETGISLAVINVLGLIGMIVLPLIASAFSYGNLETGILIGGILQSMGHVVGSAFAVGHEVGAFATIVKMSRIAFLIPFLLVMFFAFRKKNDGTKLRFPIFIILFLIAVALSHTPLFDKDTLKLLSKSGDYLLNIAMAAIGLKINLKALWKISGKALASGAIIFVVQILIYVIYLSVYGL